MTPEEFVGKWGTSTLNEKQAAHDHFADLCRLLDEPTPTNADPTGETYCFERRVAQVGGRPGWADVWRKDRFAWEYKSPGEDLDKAFAQLQRYAPALGNPPLLITCDLRHFRVHTNWTYVVSEVHEIGPADLLDPAKRLILKWAFCEPDRLRPTRTREALTAEAAARFAALATRLERRGHAPGEVAHFLIRLVFCMFAESVGLLHNRLFSRMLDSAAQHPDRFADRAAQLFAAMKSGGEVGFEEVQWFNGGLFDDATALPLDAADIAAVQEAATLDWSDIDPAIMGTLFERGLTPERRGELARAIEQRDAAGRSLGAVGIYYTPAAIIRRLIEPVVIRPLRGAWEKEQAEIRRHLDAERAAGTLTGQRRARRLAEASYNAYLERLRTFRVLDPACGSGNFLYLALMALKDLEHEVLVQGEAMGFGRAFALIGPEAVKGIEVNPLAVELARASVWIGEIQWRHRHGAPLPRNPVLKPLETVEYRNALLTEFGAEAPWPVADVIIGNPPFLGNKAMLRALGEGETTRIRSVYGDRVPDAADLVCYWFEKARSMIADATVQRAGLVATNSIRGGANRAVLDRIRDTGTIFEAWPDEPWEQDGAAVRVSLICFGQKGSSETPRMNGQAVTEIFSDLTGGAADLTTAKRLTENRGIAFMATTKGGAFDIDGATARRMLDQPINPNGRRNADVVRPWVNGLDITRRPRDRWIIDFGVSLGEREAALYEMPFEHLRSVERERRLCNPRAAYAPKWWHFVKPRPQMRSALIGLPRFIATARVAKHRLFTWLDHILVPDCQLIVFARDDDTTFGILHSRFHELWSLRQCTWLGKGNDPRYTPSTTFETFPFPDGLTLDRPAAAYAGEPQARAIAEAARRLNDLREAWLNPSDLVERVPEVMPGFPDRIVPRNTKAAAALKARTLTNLYNTMPDWLRAAHADLDAAVAAAYGWPADLADEEVLARLLALNLERAVAQRPPVRRRPRVEDERQFRFHFNRLPPLPAQGELPLAGGAAEAPAKRPKAPRLRPEPERRQRHFQYVIRGGKADQLRMSIEAISRAA
ncbi:class I SAM-dependent DNA methyltransferase [Azospirillum sp.]|uniref:class I SAM-dependent DNA methyltransferase n=1 Tax=Azospirillum sp. TaxID=34012 RepID=UPI003D75C65E